MNYFLEYHLYQISFLLQINSSRLIFLVFFQEYRYDIDLLYLKEHFNIFSGSRLYLIFEATHDILEHFFSNFAGRSVSALLKIDSTENIFSKLSRIYKFIQHACIA